VQSQALRWCIGRENPVLPKTEADKPVQFWQYKRGTGQVGAAQSKQWARC
jgi:SWI/SNF-related matrix-associated actin-dependent regulator of chromatin subfamily A3